MQMMSEIPFELSHSQLGYRAHHGRKQIFCRSHPKMRGIFGSPVFSIIEVNEFSRHALNSPKRHEFVFSATLLERETDFGTWMVGDFSGIKKGGIYQAWCGNTAGPSFGVRDDIYRRIVPELVRYFQVQSCGREVPGWHSACHLDDGFCPETGSYIEAVGGWHDAGDFRKWVSSTSVMAIGLLIAHQTWGGREEMLGLPNGTFFEEAMQGVHYFLSMQNSATGQLYNNVGGGGSSVHDNDENRYTDNVPRSGDERRIHAAPPNSPPKFTTLFALYANALKASNPALAARCAQAAIKSADYDRTEGSRSAEWEQWRAWGFLELWRFGRDERYRMEALASLDALLALQVKEYVGGQKITRGFFRSNSPRPGYHHKHIGADYPIWVIAEFVKEFPDHPERERWVDAIRLWVDEYALVFDVRNPFGMLPYALYDEPQPDHPQCAYRQIGENLFFRYFTADNPFGRNARASLTAVALSAAARVLGRSELLDIAYQQLDWILGANPMMLSTVNGVGVRQPSALSFMMGNIPGGVTMGIGGDAHDMPSYFNGTHPWLCCDEYYGYQAGQFLWAVVALESQQWSS
jgi:Glycosyl hydrolase family 9